jgi:hypothetical protein
MLKLLDAGENVIACEVVGGIAAGDLERLLARLEQSLKIHPKTHVFLQIDDLKDIDWKAVAANIPRGLQFLRDLGRFGRVAVVSDDKWVRAWTRTESALLPVVRYELFHSDECARALDWVAGQIGEPHQPALSFLETDNPLVLAFKFDGTMTPREMDHAMVELKPRLNKDLGPLNVLARIGDLAVSEPTSFLDSRYFAFKKDVLARVDRYALVGGPRWLELMTKGLAPLVPFELRHFPAEQESAAWEWVGAHPVDSTLSVILQAELA